MVAILILSTADFHSAVWTNKQHLAAGLARSFDVGYVESIGLRRPTLSKADFKRVLNRFSSIRERKDGENAPTRLSIIRPKAIPFHASRIARSFNKVSLAKTITDWKSKNSGPYILWTFSPLSYGLEDYFDATIYHSVDFLHHIPGIPSEILLKAEGEILSKADAVVCSSVVIASHLHKLGRQDVLVWENVADTDVFIPDCEQTRSEQAIFAGNLTPTKVDFGLLEKIADHGIRVVLAGPISIDGQQSEARLSKLLANPNIEYLGNKSPSELARLMNQSTVGLIPYLSNSYTEGVFPMKVYEYLASGLSVISTNLPSLRHVQDEDILRATNEDEYVRFVGHRLAATGDDVAQRKKRSAAFSWTSRTKDAKDLIESLVA